MRFRASNKRWISALAAAVMVCVCVTASAQSYRLGDEADEIATIQTALKQLKLYSAGITGHYGEKTETAVKKFQKKYALEDNGVVDEATRAALQPASPISPVLLPPPVLLPLILPFLPPAERPCATICAATQCSSSSRI